MNLYELQCKVNLPAVGDSTSQIGREAEFFKKLPKYGWVSYNKDHTRVLQLFDMVSGFDAAVKLYRMFANQRPELVDGLLKYSQRNETKIHQSYMRKTKAEHLYKISREEIESGHTGYGKHRKVKVSKLIDDLGFRNFINNTKSGIITEKVITDRSIRGGSATAGEGLALETFLIPSYFAPNKIASLDMVTFDGKLFRPNGEPFYCPIEMGWFGDLDSKMIVPSVEELHGEPGCTWDIKADTWTRYPMRLSPDLSVSACIAIWRQACHTIFTKSPLELIRDKHGIERIKEHLGGLTCTQVKELEKFTGEKLLSYWEAQSHKNIEVSGIKFSYRNQRYYVIRANGEEHEYTNFALRLTKCEEVAEDKFMVSGTIEFNGTETPFEIAQEDLRDFRPTIDALTKTFLRNGLGIPMVAPSYRTFLTNVILTFNPEFTIENRAKDRVT